MVWYHHSWLPGRNHLVWLITQYHLPTPQHSAMAPSPSSSPNAFGRSTREPYIRRDNANTANGKATATSADVEMSDNSSSFDDSFRLVAKISYDGTNYEGFQTQASGNTIQDIIETRLSKLFDHRIYIAASGRTDAGVHAKGQVIHFDTPKNANVLGKRAAGHLRKALQSDSCTASDIAALLESALGADAWRVDDGTRFAELALQPCLCLRSRLGEICWKWISPRPKAF